jgi:CRP-like cAMP-binding protein
MDGGPRTATVVAETPLTALALSRKDFRSMLESEPHVTVGLLKHAAQLLRRLEHPASG